MSCEAPIGVFDSGVGGLTVVKEILTQLPKERIIYFGDTARVPYGSKSKETVTAYSRQIIKFLQSKNVKAIVIACNTASALALDTVAKEVDIPLIGVVKPGAKIAAETTKNGKIGVIATEATIRSGLYHTFLKATNPELEVFGQPCPLFVPLVEEGWTNDPITREIAKRYMSGLQEKEIDTLVLGCTHYPLLREIIRDIVGEQVILVNPALETAKCLKEILISGGLQCKVLPMEEKKSKLRKEEYQESDHMFYVSDGTEKFRAFANSILPCDMIETKDVNIKTFD